MAKWAILGLILAILLVDRPGVIAYRSGGSGYRSGSEQAEQVGLSAAHSGHSAYGGEQQPIYQRESACPQNFQGLVAYPHDCHRFVNCNGGSATIQTCSPGTLFNPKTLQCDHPTNVDCSSAGGGAVAPAETTRLGRLRQLDSDPKCPNGVNGLHPHPTDCTKFLNCANGHAFIQDCGPGTAFNPSLLVCVHKGTVNCGGAGGSGSSGHAYSAVSSEQLGCPPGTRGLHPHPHDPHKYLRCGIGVQPQVEQCPQGQIFDGFRLVCVYSGSAQTSSSALTSAALQVNNLLCPAGAVGLFVHPFDQTKFINCKVNMVQSCQPGYVFSISRGYCHPKSQLVVSDYVTLIISLISLEYSFILTSCPGDIEGYHLYPYDAGRYVQCSAGGRMSILSCDPQKAFSLSQRACLPRRQVNQADRVKFWEEIQVHTTTTYYQDSQGRSQSQLSSLKSCPSNLRKNYAYPFHAGHYIKCQNGVLEIVCCPTGTLFSLSQHECVARHLLAAHDYLDYAYISVQFSTEFMDDLSTVTCPPQTEGYYLHPFDCTKYIKCFNQQTYIESCHQGEVFSIPQQRCLPKDEVKKPNDRVEYLIETTVTTTHHMTEPIPKEKSLDYAGDISCPPGVSGLHAHPFDCAKFLECANGLTYVKDCGPGTAFSTASGTCDFANKVDCSGRSSSAGLNQLSQGHPSPGYPTGPVQTYSPPQTAYNPSPTSEHLSDLLCPHGADGQFVHPFDQTKFLLCKAAKLAVQSCESGHVFSISWGTCQPKTQLVYTDYVSYVVSEISHELSMILSACPGGTDGLHLYPYDAGKYVRCSDGGKMSILSCGPQMAFSLSQRACRPSRQVINGDRVKFWEELTTTTTTYTYQDAQVHQSPLRGCPPTLQGNYPYPFHAGHFVKCQNGLLQVVCCPSGSLYSLSKRECVARHLLSAHDYLDHAYISVQFSTDFMQDLTTLTCPPQAQGYYLHPFDCTKYLICRDQQTSIGSCDQGEVFSISQQKCVVRDKVTDAFDRVEYLSETQHELSQEADEEQEQGRNGGYPSNGAIALTGRYQRPDQATEYQTPPYSYPSPSIGGVQSPAKPTGQYQPPPHSSAGYQPLSPVTGGYQQPQYSGGYQQNTQTSGGYQQPSQFTGGYQPSAQPSGGYQQPSQFSGGYQQAHQSSGGYQQPSQSTGGYPPYSQNNGGYQWSSQAQGGSHGASVPNGGYQTTNKFTGGYQSAGGPYSQGGASYYPGGVQPSAPPAPLMCPQRVNGLFPNPFDAMGYLTCIEGHTLVRQCLPLDVFSISRGYCLPEHLVVATDRIPFVKQQSEQEDLLGCPRGAIGFYVYPFDCSQYLSCGPNGMTLLSCPEEQHFSVSHGICKPQGQVQREDRLYTLNELHIIYDWTQKMMAEGAVPACPEGITGSLPHPRVSSKYLRCEPGHAAIYDCPSQQIFSVSRRLCVLDEKLPSHDRSDYLVRVEGTSGGWIAPSNDNRQSKSYETSGRDQWGNRYTTKTTTTTRVISEGDRWRDMNMQRPAGIGLEQNPHHQQGSWSGQESSYVQREPSQNVLYVEGSLQPNRKYHSTYKTPLAPMAPIAPSNPGQVYYAQPVLEEKEPERERPVPSRQGYSRRIDHGSPGNGWQPMPPLAPLGGQRPINPASPGASREPASYNPLLSGQRPLDLDYDDQQKPQDPYDEVPPSQGSPPLPGSPPRFYPDQLPSGTAPRGSHLQPGQAPVPSNYDPRSPPNQHRPEDPQGSNALPLSNESNLYGGLLPPRADPPTDPKTSPFPTPTPTPTPSSQTPLPQLGSRLHTFPIYPPLGNGTAPPRNPSHPHYSPSYAGISHSRNASWAKVPAVVTKTPTYEPDPFNPEEEESFYDDDDFTTTTQKSALVPPPFDHKFYSPNSGKSPAGADPNSELAMKEALKLMLRPYFNHSGNAQEKLAKQAESAIVSVISKPPTTTPSTTTSTTRSTNIRSTTTRSTTPIPPSKPDLDYDAELIKAGEQESLDSVDDDYVFPDARETARTEQTLDPSSTYSSTNFHRSTRRAMIDTTPTTTTTATNNWHAPGHSRDYHRRHPNLPDPFSKHYPNHNPYPSPHHHQKHHPHHEHSADFHRRHPELPNPFPKAVEPDHQPEEEQEEDWEPNPNAEEVTPKVGVRSSFTEDCEFDCGNGKCLKKEQVCNGQKNCDNGKDELNCPPRDYEVRLTGGEKPHMGRIEVKANGQWGYVCDDKFGLKDADVVCRELGFPMGAQEVRGSSFYAPPNQDFNYVMDEVECRGNETKLSECPFKGWGVHNCGVDEVAGVICKVPVMKCPNNYWLCHTSKECIPPAFVCDNTEDCADKSDECAAVCQAPVQYRLEGGRSPTEGRLEVKYHGVWGSVCDDDFNQKSAQVACNSMGFYGPATIEKNIFGNGNGPIWLDQVMCFGNETGIDKCSHWNWGENNCNHTEDVALHCTAGPPPRSQKLSQNPIKGGRQESAAKSYNQIGLWERSSKALRTPRRCGIFKDDLTDEYAHHEERVVRGNVAQRGRHPWQATIRTRGRGHISSHWCGAVVISKRHLLTAAHCVYGTQKGAYFVRVGDHYANIAESSEVDTFIETWYIHEEFRKGTHMNNDIALVVLKTPLKFSDYVQPICLPEKNGELVENRNCTISGWGSIKAGVSTPAQVLGSAELPILPDHVCKQSNVYGSAMSEGMFCAGFMDESVDACEGDSGGPLVCPDDDGETLYGLISWGQHCGYKNRPGVYVRVNHYIDWIYEKINESMQRF
ncbi:uncharacterized protein teq isoform X1 [Drosophila kikkawai]|uniref:Uncharacterized protein teq isoform X1 n=1 Tax=Drosophila kikkawai TaxID=30033 RepID=A0A6P4J1C4_DROKI|nr:uncharacterized protein LOC108078766 isoform X1 [Drosophila kikkawai]